MKSRIAWSDIYVQTTDTIVQAIEQRLANGSFEMPWHRQSCGAKNQDGRLYSGVNTLLLAIAQWQNGFSQSRWGTYRAWSEKGCTVRKGCKGTRIVFFKPITREAEDGTEERRGAVARGYVVFNRCQVDGVFQEPPGAFASLLTDDELLPERKLRAAIAGMGCGLQHGQGHAAYVPSRDTVLMPDRGLFKSAV